MTNSNVDFIKSLKPGTKIIAKLNSSGGEIIYFVVRHFRDHGHYNIIAIDANNYRRVAYDHISSFTPAFWTIIVCH